MVISMTIGDRLTYIDLSNLYNNTSKYSEAPTLEPGLIALGILRIYELEPILAISTSPDIKDYETNLVRDWRLLRKIDDLLPNKDLLEATKTILEEDESLVAVVIFDGYNTGVAFAKSKGDEQ